MDNLWWGFWSDYPKVTLNGRQYAKIGQRLYTQHAVERFRPSGRRSIGGFPRTPGEGGSYTYDDKSRSIMPSVVENAIRAGKKTFSVEKGEPRTVHEANGVQVVTTRDERIVISCRYSHE